MLRTSILVSSILLAVACTPPPAPMASAKGSPTGMPATGSVGMSGGSVVAGALTITVPAGVFAQNTTLTATPLSSTAPGSRGQAMRLEPEGMTFAQPVTLTFHYEDSDLAGTAPEALLIAFQHSSGVWAVPGEVSLDTSARTLSVQTTHFSDWTMVAGAQLRPPSASVKVNETVKLTARRCFATPEPSTKVEAELAPLLLGFSCDDDDVDVEVASLPVVTSDWSVNGVAGGSGSTGTVVGELARGTFAAPGTKPTPNTVAVSARVDFAKKGKVLLVSNVTINDGAKRVLVRAKYAKAGQTLTAFVTGAVADEGFSFEMPFPVSDGELTVMNLSGGSASGLMDTRAGCLQPTLGGSWDELRATSVTVTGNFLNVQGESSRPAITLGVGEGDCATTSRIEPGRTEPDGIQVALPIELFNSSAPAAPVSTTEAGWTFTYTTQ